MAGNISDRVGDLEREVRYLRTLVQRQAAKQQALGSTKIVNVRIVADIEAGAEGEVQAYDWGKDSPLDTVFTHVDRGPTFQAGNWGNCRTLREGEKAYAVERFWGKWEILLSCVALTLVEFALSEALTTGDVTAEATVVAVKYGSAVEAAADIVVWNFACEDATRNFWGDVGNHGLALGPNIGTLNELTIIAMECPVPE